MSDVNLSGLSPEQISNISRDAMSSEGIRNKTISDIYSYMLGNKQADISSRGVDVRERVADISSRGVDVRERVADTGERTADISALDLQRKTLKDADDYLINARKAKTDEDRTASFNRYKNAIAGYYEAGGRQQAPRRPTQYEIETPGKVFDAFRQMNSRPDKSKGTYKNKGRKDLGWAEIEANAQVFENLDYDLFVMDAIEVTEGPNQDARLIAIPYPQGMKLTRNDIVTRMVDYMGYRRDQAEFVYDTWNANRKR